ncbi:MAG TPA: hypothetical protein VG818_07665, partial [Gemmatimonadaceae bacterium]|nr:hypothetical protein [Gemmatimonadaceae bacterium]
MALLVAVAAIVGVSACSENLDSSAACPSLCPGQSVTLQDTILPAIAIDSSVPGFPAIGQEPFLLVAGRGDTLETRGIIRFDSLPLVFHRTNAAADSAITAVDSAYIRFQLDTGGVKPGAPVTISLFDVDTTAADTVTSALAGLFRPDRFLGSATFAPESLVDSIKVP